MKKFFLVVVALCFAVLVSNAQGFHSVHSPNGLDVWAVGNNGNVFHSFDGGNTWTQATQGTATLRSVYAMDNMVWIVGDDGKFLSSTDGGTNFASTSPAGAVALTRIFFVNNQTGFMAGANGLIMKTTNGGSTWASQTTGTSERITSLEFTDLQTGYAGGLNGTILKTVNGGATWTSIAGSGWSKDVLSVHAKGQTLYVTGAEGFCYKSANAGSSWTPLNFYTDSHVDVNNVFIRDANKAFFIGGGGFIRSTVNGGASFSYATHPLYAKLNDIFFYDSLSGWACSEKNNAVIRTTNGGATWQLPQGTTVNYNWVNKATGGSIGNTFMINPWNRNRIYVVLGTTVWMSGDRGETWSTTATIAGGGSTWSFYISPKDTNLWIAATSGGGKGIRRSTNRGQTWTTTITRNFTSYGMPLEMDPDNPDTVIFAAEGTSSGPDGILYLSKNFGATWDTLSRTQFRSPCDLVIVPGNTSIWYCGDGVTGSGAGQMWSSGDYGHTWSPLFSVTGSEIPMIAVSRLRNSDGFATAWGSGGVRKTDDGGRTWNSIATTASTWGVDIAKDDPNVVMYGVYGGSTSYLSNNAGATFVSTALTGSNSAILAYDRSTFLAHQAGNGIWKYAITYTVPTTNVAALAVTSPNGGENWQFGTQRNITWNSTNVSNVRIEYKTSAAGSWQTIVTNTPSLGSYSWTIPNAATTQARVRISDAVSGVTRDSSDNVFSITVAAIAANPTSINFGTVPVGSRRTEIITLTNSGTGPLIISSVTSSNASFIAGRGSFTIPQSQSDTLSVSFVPTANQTFSDQLTIACNVPTGSLIVPLTGTTSSLAILAPNGGEVWAATSVHAITWSALGLANLEISYKISPSAPWARIVQSISAALGSFAWTVPNTPSSQVRVRIVDRATGALVDSSDNVFTIQGSTSVAEVGGIPTTYELNQNFPNPFNPSTVIIYGVPKDEFVTIKVFNMIGQEVVTLVNERQAAGRYSVTFDTQQLNDRTSSGLYLYKLTAGDFVETRKMMLLK